MTNDFEPITLHEKVLFRSIMLPNRSKWKLNFKITRMNVKSSGPLSVFCYSINACDNPDISYIFRRLGLMRWNVTFLGQSAPSYPTTVDFSVCATIRFRHMTYQGNRGRIEV